MLDQPAHEQGRELPRRLPALTLTLTLTLTRTLTRTRTRTLTLTRSRSRTLTLTKAASCLDVSLLCGLLASGHTDHILRLWDPRCAPQAQHQLSLRHKGWVSGVAWSRHRAQLLLSSCHDGIVRLWDTRSTVPLHELPPHQDKALCVAWDGADAVVSGGTDGQLRISTLAA